MECRILLSLSCTKFIQSTKPDRKLKVNILWYFCSMIISFFCPQRKLLPFEEMSGPAAAQHPPVLVCSTCLLDVDPDTFESSNFRALFLITITLSQRVLVWH